MDDRITTKAPYGKHIPLMCINHPELRWHTKNISRIGARTIFFNDNGVECQCPQSALRVALPSNAPDVPE